MELLSLLIFSALFLYSGYKHIRFHSALTGYARSAFGNCPVGDQLAYLGGWPTGVFLIAASVGTIINDYGIFAYGLAAFLAVSGALFHRDIKDPAVSKHYALLGAALFIASQAPSVI